LTVRSLPSDTPAYEQGLNTGDQIVAIDGNRASQTFLTSYIGEKKPGDKVRMTIFRFDRLRDIEFTLGRNIRRSYEFATVENVSDVQKKLYQDYLLTELK
jgi:predicted metalloprotease with PDZ domain